MKQIQRTFSGPMAILLAIVGISLVLATCVSTAGGARSGFPIESFAQSAPATGTPTQVAGVDETKMGAYRALAQLAYRFFEKGDLATAAMLSRILERTWDHGAEKIAEKSHDTFETIDNSMDAFISPIIRHAKRAPDPIKVKAAYEDYLEKLKLADSPGIAE